MILKPPVDDILFFIGACDRNFYFPMEVKRMDDHNEKHMDMLRTWLKDAYAMEQGIVEVLERQIGQFDEMPDAQMRIQQHLDLTKSQAERVRGCVERLGDDVSQVKASLANFLGAVQGMSTAMADDKMVKNAMAAYAIEHFEIASYMAIAAAASEMGHEDIATICDGIIQEEMEMADWLRMQLPMVVHEHMMVTIRK
jgi:ferritin-like metal-binding protein YciE